MNHTYYALTERDEKCLQTRVHRLHNCVSVSKIARIRGVEERERETYSYYGKRSRDEDNEVGG